MTIADEVPFRLPGFTASKTSRLSCSLWPFPNTIRCCMKMVSSLAHVGCAVLLLTQSPRSRPPSESINRMQEALVLFDSICNSRWFVRTSIILFLNKIDLFREKITRSPISNFFPDYTGGTDLQAACDYFSSRFVGLNQSSAKQIYTHFTCATDASRVIAWRQAG